MEDMELICFQIIANAGSAKSGYIKAFRFAREGKFDEVEKEIEESKKMYLKAHEAHQKLITKEASGEKIEFSLILMHAEDQLLNADTVGALVMENIELIKMIKGQNE